LSAEAPGFAVKGEQVEVMTEPDEFYQRLCRGVKEAKKRVVLASLYLGTGPKEAHLLDCLEECLSMTSSQKKEEEDISDVRVKILLDYSRGNRLVKDNKSSATMLKPIIQKYPGNVEVSFYHTPSLRSIPKKVLPTKTAELVGVQHCKVYLFDDSLIISGANLSNDYFTDRQDRYVLIKDCPKLADFFEGLVENISHFSLQMCVNDEDDQVEFRQKHSTADFDGGHPYDGDFRTFVSAANKKIQSYVSRQLAENDLSSKKLPSEKMEEKEKEGFEEETNGDDDTLIFASVQMGQLDVRHDSRVTQKFLEAAMTSSDPGAILKFGTGYFNPTDEYLQTILSKDETGPEVDIIMAHPEANSFYRAPFPLGGVPHAYTNLAKKFYERAATTSGGRIKMYEYQRSGWTFHCKGLWYYEGGGGVEPLPSATMVGSPNFGYRSVEKDLESQLTIVTRNRKLQRALHQEQKRVFEASRQVSPETFAARDRWTPLWVKAVTGIARRFF